jgi:hypothetical protein
MKNTQDTPGFSRGSVNFNPDQDLRCRLKLKLHAAEAGGIATPTG